MKIQQRTKPTINPLQESVIDRIRKKLGHFTGEKPVQLWLDTKQPLLHRVLGSPKKGIPYGKMIEISGNESHGKSFLLLELAKYAQADGAYVIWVDFESSFDGRWARRRGLNTDNMTVIQPYLKKMKSNKEAEMAGCETLCKETIEVIKVLSKKYDRFFVGVDSIAAMVTERELDAGETDANMATNTDLSRFLSRTLKQWIGHALVHNAMFVFINQLRTRPGVMFGNPEYTPGGKAIPYYVSIRVKIRRGQNRGKMIHGGEQIGVKGTIENYKNKVGAGSLENEKIGFKFNFSKPAEFVTVKDTKGDE